MPIVSILCNLEIESVMWSRLTEYFLYFGEHFTIWSCYLTQQAFKHVTINVRRASSLRNVNMLMTGLRLEDLSIYHITYYSCSYSPHSPSPPLTLQPPPQKHQTPTPISSSQLPRPQPVPINITQHNPNHIFLRHLRMRFHAQLHDLLQSQAAFPPHVRSKRFWDTGGRKTVGVVAAACFYLWSWLEIPGLFVVHGGLRVGGIWILGWVFGKRAVL